MTNIKTKLWWKISNLSGAVARATLSNQTTRWVRINATFGYCFWADSFLPLFFFCSMNVCGFAFSIVCVLSAVSTRKIFLFFGYSHSADFLYIRRKRCHESDQNETSEKWQLGRKKNNATNKIIELICSIQILDENNLKIRRRKKKTRTKMQYAWDSKCVLCLSIDSGAADHRLALASFTLQWKYC